MADTKDDKDIQKGKVIKQLRIRFRQHTAQKEIINAYGDIVLQSQELEYVNKSDYLKWIAGIVGAFGCVAFPIFWPITFLCGIVVAIISMNLWEMWDKYNNEMMKYYLIQYSGKSQGIISEEVLSNTDDYDTEYYSKRSEEIEKSIKEATEFILANDKQVLRELNNLY